MSGMNGWGLDGFSVEGAAYVSHIIQHVCVRTCSGWWKEGSVEMQSFHYSLLLGSPTIQVARPWEWVGCVLIFQ